MQADPITGANHQVQEPLSYWHRTSEQVVLSTDLPSTVDVAVVGGGLLGAATSYWLARSGVNTVLLERSGIVYGATGRNGGFVSVGTAEGYPGAIERLGHEAARKIMTLTYESQQLLRQVLAEEEIDCDYREPGNLYLALSEDQHTAIARAVEALQREGFVVHLLDRAQTQKLVDTPLGPEIVGGRFMPGQGLLHSARLVQGLVRAAQRHGAQLCRATVQRLEREGEGVLLHTSQGKVHAGAAVIAVNAWTGELLPVLEKYIVPVRGQMLAYAPIVPVFKTSMSTSATSTGEYWQQTVDGSIVLGGCREVAPGRDVGIRVNQPTQEVQTALEQLFPRLFPQLKGLQIVQRWAGLMAFTPDYLPIADRVPDIPGAWFVGGFSGHGMVFGIKMGQLLASAATTGEAPAALRPLCLDRPTL